jgi:hypothetical protein
MPTAADILTFPKLSKLCRSGDVDPYARVVRMEVDSMQRTEK